MDLLGLGDQYAAQSSFVSESKYAAQSFFDWESQYATQSSFVSELSPWAPFWSTFGMLNKLF